MLTRKRRYLFSTQSVLDASGVDRENEKTPEFIELSKNIA